LGKLTLRDFGALFGGDIEEVEKYCGEFIRTFSWQYEPCTGAYRDRLLLTVLQHTDSQELKTSGLHRAKDWEDGWTENLKEFTASGFDVEKLVPKYFKQNVPVRLLGDYILPSDPNFVLNVTRSFRLFIFKKYLSGCREIHEFGCGTGHHLVCFQSIAPDKAYFGYDWAPSSQEILRILLERKGWNILGRRFDFFSPDTTVVFGRDAGVMTFGSLEQLGAEHGKYLGFILEKKPMICVDIVGLAELYDKDVLLDYVALRYHKRKHYLDGYLKKLRELESKGNVQILKVHRQKFGNLYDDPHSYVVWKTVK